MPEPVRASYKDSRVKRCRRGEPIEGAWLNHSEREREREREREKERENMWVQRR